MYLFTLFSAFAKPSKSKDSITAITKILNDKLRYQSKTVNNTKVVNHIAKDTFKDIIKILNDKTYQPKKLNNMPPKKYIK